MTKLPLLFLIIFLEGYVVLSTELLAIRLTFPFVGSGTDTVSIIIAAVLMPLAIGYHSGGKFRPRKEKEGGYFSIRHKLIANLLIATTFLTFGLSYYVINSFFEFLIEGLGWNNRLLITALYASIFIVTPVYLLGQTVPLISNYFFRSRISEAAGNILFFSTIGSFCGAIFSTLFFMNTVGVGHTATVSIICMALLVIFLSRKIFTPHALLASFFLASAMILNSDAMLSRLHIIHSNVYNTVQIFDVGKHKVVRHMQLNHAPSSIIFPDEPETPIVHYRKFIENYFISEMKDWQKPGKILVLGAGGFTIGLHDQTNEYIFVDIDPDLKNITEEKFLERKLTPNKAFVAQPARAFLIQNGIKFDIIVMDIVGSITGAPEHLVTREFFAQIRNHLKDDGIVFINIFASVLFDDDYSRNLDNTIRSVFPHVSRQTITGANIWRSRQNTYKAVLYYSRKDKLPTKEVIYTDNLNRAALDKKLSIAN